MARVHSPPQPPAGGRPSERPPRLRPRSPRHERGPDDVALLLARRERVRRQRRVRPRPARDEALAVQILEKGGLVGHAVEELAISGFSLRTAKS